MNRSPCEIHFIEPFFHPHKTFLNVTSNSSTVLLINWYVIIKTIWIQSSRYNSSFRKTGRHFENNAFCPSFTFICHLNTDFSFSHGKKGNFTTVLTCCQGRLYCHSKSYLCNFLLPDRIIHWPSLFRQNRVGYDGTTHLLHITSLSIRKETKESLRIKIVSTSFPQCSFQVDFGNWLRLKIN